MKRIKVHKQKGQTAATDPPGATRTRELRYLQAGPIGRDGSLSIDVEYDIRARSYDLLVRIREVQVGMSVPAERMTGTPADRDDVAIQLADRIAREVASAAREQISGILHERMEGRRGG